MKHFSFLSFFFLSLLSGSVYCTNGFFNVREYGAVGDGKSSDTKAIASAIQACKDSGGGTVFFPAGIYLTGTIHLISNLTLHIGSGATILGSKDPNDYQATRGPKDGPKFLNIDNEVWYQSLIQGKNLHHVSILGPGVIDGNKVFNRRGEARMRGPHGILLDDCRFVTLRDVEVVDASNFAILLFYCTVVNCDGLTVSRGWDGIHIRDVKNCTISNCRFMTGDDAIAGWNLKNVTISNCVLNSACSAFRLGGQDVLINNCMVYGPCEYDDITSGRRASRGFLYHVSKKTDPRCPLDSNRPSDDNIVMQNVSMSNVLNPFWIQSWGKEPTGRFRFSNITVVDCGRSPFFIAGKDTMIKSVSVENCHFSFIGGGNHRNANFGSVSSVSTMESYGLYALNADEINFRNVHFELDAPDTRPAVFVSKTRKAVFSGFMADRSVGGDPTFQLSDVETCLIDGKEFPRAKPIVLDMKTATENVTSGSPYVIAVTVKNKEKQSAFVDIPLNTGSKIITKQILLDAGETADVHFIHLRNDKSGIETASVWNKSLSFPVSEKPKGYPPTALFKSFQNTSSTIQQYNQLSGFVQSSGDYVSHFRVDQYGAIFLPRCLEDKGTVIVRFDEEGIRGAGRGGIMVKNDISKPDESTGYITLDASPSGFAMQWDADGDGRLDSKTSFDGYAIYPAWLKLERSGNTFTGFYSIDGMKTWSKIAEIVASGTDNIQDVGIYAHNSVVKYHDFSVR